MDDRTAFTIAFPEARRTRIAGTVAAFFFLVFWILWGVDLFGSAGKPDLPWLNIALVPFALFLGYSIYARRKQKELAHLINRRFADEFVAHTQGPFPQDVDVLKVKRSIAVERTDGTVVLWGIERKKDTFTVFPMN